MEMKFNSTSIAKICLSTIEVDVSVFLDRIIDRIINESLLESLNENLHGYSFSEYQDSCVSNSSNSLREFVLKMSYKQQEFTPKKMSKLFEYARVLNREMSCFECEDFDYKLNNIERSTKEIFEHGTCHYDNNDINETTFIGSVQVCSNTDFIINVNPVIEHVPDKAKNECTCTTQGNLIISIILTSIIGLYIDRKVKNIFNALKFPVTSTLSSKPQLSTVICENVDVYKEKSSYSDKLGNLRYGEKVKIIGSSKDWYEVENMNTSDSWFSGYIPNRSVDYYIQ